MKSDIKGVLASYNGLIENNSVIHTIHNFFNTISAKGKIIYDDDIFNRNLGFWEV